MSRTIKLTENDLNRLVKKVIYEQNVASVPTTTQQQPLMNEVAVKTCLDTTYGKGKGIGKTAQGGLIYNINGLVTVFYLNGRYGQEYTKTKGNFNCSSGKAILTNDNQGISPTTKPAAKVTATPTTPVQKGTTTKPTTKVTATPATPTTKTVTPTQAG